MIKRLSRLASCVFLATAALAPAQFSFAQTTTAFGGVKADITAPVELAADHMSVDQGTGKAVLTGNITIAQGQMRLSALKVTVTYGDAERRRIKTLEAEGDVLLVSGPDAAEARNASYDVSSGIVTLTGDVLLSQGVNIMSSQKMTINLATGSAQAEGRVRSVLQPSRP